MEGVLSSENENDFTKFVSTIRKLLTKSLVKDDTWYLISSKWFRKFEKYAELNTSNLINPSDLELCMPPGPIDNKTLYADAEYKRVQSHLLEVSDYVLVPEEAWTLLVHKFGLANHQQPICRKVIEYGNTIKERQVEIYPIEVQLYLNEVPKKPVTKYFSKTDTIDLIEKNARQIFNIPINIEIRLLKVTAMSCDILEYRNKTLSDYDIGSCVSLIVEKKNLDGSWSKLSKNNVLMMMGPTSSQSLNSGRPNIDLKDSSLSSRITYLSTFHEISSGNFQPGICGLLNLGNTCFMNSIIQLLSNTPQMTKYFLNDEHLKELNFENPLGMKGEIAKTFGDLIKYMWSGNVSHTSPHHFKMQVGKFAPQFSGYQQHDSQELLTFILDGLHEDLNRIKVKPYVELKDDNGRPDKIVAQESWDNYRKRNDSIIVDLFHGLLKSTVICPECNKVSITFDPFCYLSVPLPVKKEKHIEVQLIYGNQYRKPLKMKVTVSKGGTVQDLKIGVSQISRISPDNLIVTEVSHHEISNIYSNDESVDSISEKDLIVVYELPSISYSNKILLCVSMQERLENENCCDGVLYQTFGLPVLLPIPYSKCSLANNSFLYNQVLDRIRRYLKSVKNQYDMDSEGEEEENEIDNNIEDDVLQTNLNQLFTLKLTSGLSDFHRNVACMVAIWDSNIRHLYYDIKKVLDDIDIHESCSQRPCRKSISLHECLELFTTKEKLGIDDAWYCPCCKKHQQATKKFDLWDLPQVLVIHLKRFFYTRYLREKLDVLVTFPIVNLDLSPYLINQDNKPALYDLIGVCNHFGGMGGGHYTACAKNKDNNQWYCFDDSSVNPVKTDSIVAKSAYVLVYMKKEDQKINGYMMPKYSSNGIIQSDNEMDSS